MRAGPHPIRARVFPKREAKTASAPRAHCAPTLLDGMASIVDSCEGSFGPLRICSSGKYQHSRPGPNGQQLGCSSQPGWFRAGCRRLRARGRGCSGCGFRAQHSCCRLARRAIVVCSGGSSEFAGGWCLEAAPEGVNDFQRVRRSIPRTGNSGSRSILFGDRKVLCTTGLLCHVFRRAEDWGILPSGARSGCLARGL